MRFTSNPKFVMVGAFVVGYYVGRYYELKLVVKKSGE